ncbi:G-type lectin S-receptor-like serine/threonine-protein kinase CES101 [Argentina anserina]|uniref:G-type lectin S-receptor-like serine/threonine-protein kinase CES101 n=1 Tax=Argentina anserina TaxID=57926 RepID=UPI0021766052|nr:G-type lectin S-receptor-like serine/threonine-protein kinase CES101 [Potentilla anserina]
MAKLRSIVFLFISCICMHSLSSSHAQTHNVTVLKQDQHLSDQAGDYLVSENGLFKLGFFSPGNSSIFGATSNRYLGIWYNKLPNDPDAVWVANPETPVMDTSGVFALASDATLELIHGGGNISISDPKKTISGNVTLSLLDTGNLVLREVATNGTVDNILWESFDHPTNTLLPGMKLGMNVEAGKNWTISSWFSDLIPARGAFRLGIDPGNTNQLIIWRRDEVYWSSGVWENGSFQNAPEMTRRVDLFEFSFVSNKEDKYFSYAVKNRSTISRWELNGWGQIMQSILTVNGTTWESTEVSPCTFDLNNPGALCIEEKPSECRNGSDGLVPVRGYFDGTEILSHDNNTNMTISDCHATCWSDCSCIGYKSIYSNGTGCVFMSGTAKFIPNDYFDATYVLNILNNSKDGSPAEGSKPSNDIKKKWWLWCIMSVIFVVALVSCYLCYIKKRKPRLMKQIRQEQGLDELRSQITRFSGIYKLKIGERIGQNFRMFSFSEVLAATENFSAACRLGQGGFGPVYKGVLPDGEQVGVKRLARSSGQGLEEFMNEITLIAELQHSNLVRLLGCCIQGEEKILIYEFMANKSLDAFLFDSDRRKQLDWQRRVHIIEGIAQGLLYLHKHSRVRVIHRDLKASNILLDENMKPKISDFGMARIFGQNESMANTVRVVGTYGYMSPEYAMRGIFSEKSDVYSFGVLLLEIISGKKNTSYLSSTGLCLIELAWELWKQGHTLEIKDTSLDSGSEEEVLKFIQVGLLCVQEYAEDRASMSEVISMLTSDVTHLPDPKQPAYTISRSGATSTTLPDSGCTTGSVNNETITVMEGR